GPLPAGSTTVVVASGRCSRMKRSEPALPSSAFVVGLTLPAALTELVLIASPTAPPSASANVAMPAVTRPRPRFLAISTRSFTPLQPGGIVAPSPRVTRDGGPRSLRPRSAGEARDDGYLDRALLASRALGPRDATLIGRDGEAGGGVASTTRGEGDEVEHRARGARQLRERRAPVVRERAEAG